MAPLAESAEQLEALLDDLTSGICFPMNVTRKRGASRERRAVGDARLAYELAFQGSCSELVSATLAAGEDELTRARRVWQRRFGNIGRRRCRRAHRQMRFLAGRGFSAETIRRLLRATLEDD
jgi:regulatory protein